MNTKLQHFIFATFPVVIVYGLIIWWATRASWKAGLIAIGIFALIDIVAHKPKHKTAEEKFAELMPK